MKVKEDEPNSATPKGERREIKFENARRDAGNEVMPSSVIYFPVGKLNSLFTSELRHVKKSTEHRRRKGEIPTGAKLNSWLKWVLIICHQSSSIMSYDSPLQPQTTLTPSGCSAAQGSGARFQNGKHTNNTICGITMTGISGQ